MKLTITVSVWVRLQGHRGLGKAEIGSEVGDTNREYLAAQVGSSFTDFPFFPARLPEGRK